MATSDLTDTARAGAARLGRGTTSGAVSHPGAPAPGPLAAWLRAARPHQWSKNVVIFAPIALGWKQVTPLGLLAMAVTLVLFSLLSSLTYLVNDIADIEADRRHATKRQRPFAAGELSPVQGLAAAIIGAPLILVLAWLISPGVAATLAAYCALTFAYSAGLKRIALADCLAIAGLFTLRVVAGMAAGGFLWSPWFLTFAVTFFFSLALAKRHTELIDGGSGASGPVPGRGYRYEDRSLTLAFGAAASAAAIVIIILYLVDEVFPRGLWREPLWLWAAPPIIFLWIGRIWLLANRGEMHDDPVVFALHDRTSWAMGAGVATAFLLAFI